MRQLMKGIKEDKIYKDEIFSKDWEGENAG